MSTEVTRIEALILVSVFPVLEVLCYVLLCMRRSDLAVRKRGMNIVCFASIAGWLAYLNLIFSATDRGGTCGVLYIFSILIPPIAAGSQLTRAIHLRAKLERSNILLKEERIHGKTRRRGSQSQSERAAPEKNVPVVAGGGVAGVQGPLPTSPSPALVPAWVAYTSLEGKRLEGIEQRRNRYCRRSGGYSSTYRLHCSFWRPFQILEYPV